MPAHNCYFPLPISDHHMASASNTYKIYLPWTDCGQDYEDMFEKLGIDESSHTAWKEAHFRNFDLIAQFGSLIKETLPQSYPAQMKACRRVRFVPNEIYSFLHRCVCGVADVCCVVLSCGMTDCVGAGRVLIPYEKCVLVLYDQRKIDVAKRRAKREGREYQEEKEEVKGVEVFQMHSDRFIRTRDKILLLPIIVKIFLAGPNHKPINR